MIIANWVLTPKVHIVTHRTLVIFVLLGSFSSVSPLPTGFADEIVVQDEFDLAPAVAVVPGQGIIVGEQRGYMYFVTGDQRSLYGTVDDVVTANERGLLSIAVGSDFGKTHHVFVYCSVAEHGFQILRFTQFETSPPQLDPASKVVLWTGEDVHVDDGLC